MTSGAFGVVVTIAAALFYETMRTLRLVATTAVLCLACSDSTGISVEGPQFMRAFIDGRPLALDDNDSFLWALHDTTLMLQGLPGTMSSTNPYIIIDIGRYHGPGTYSLAETPPGSAMSVGMYGLYDVAGAPIQRFQTTGAYMGSITVTAEDSATLTLVGTFQFSAVSTYGAAGEAHITAGSFRIRQPQ